MLAYTYVEHGKFELRDKPRPVLRDARDAIVRVTLASICTSDLHIKHGSVPRAVPGITVGHEMVGVVEEVALRQASAKCRASLAHRADIAVPAGQSLSKLRLELLAGRI